MSGHDEDRPVDGTADAPDADDADVEAQGLREVMSVGLAAAAFVGAPGQVKAAESPSGAGDQAVLVEHASIDIDLDGYLSFKELEQAGYTANVELLQREGYDVSLEQLEAAGYKALGRYVDEFADAEAVMLKRGVDPGLDVILDYGVASWPSKLSEIDLDGDGYLGFSELEKAGYKASLDLLHADGYDVSLESLDEAGMKVAAHRLHGFLADGDTLMLKRGIDTGLDLLLDYGVADWPNKLSEIDADSDGYVSFAELERAGYKANVDLLQATGHDVTIASLEEAGYKVRAWLLHEFMSDLETVSMKEFVDPTLDALLRR